MLTLVPTPHLYRTREAWLEARREPGCIGASEAPVILGVSPHERPWDFWERRVGAGSSGQETEPLRRGHRWESAVLAEYEDASGHRVLQPGEHYRRPGSIVVLSHPEHPWLRQSPDAFATDPHGGLGQVEAKTALDPRAWSPEHGVVVERWEDGCEDLVPPHYAVQAYVQLEVSGLPWVDLTALVPARGWLEVRWVRLLRDEDTQRSLVEALAAWREQHLVRREPPPVDGSGACSRYLAKNLTVPEKRPMRVAAFEEAERLRTLAAARAVIRATEDEARRLSAELVALCPGGERLALGEGKGTPYGQPQVQPGRESVDLERLRRDFPEAAAACLRRGEPTAFFATYRFNGKDR